MLIRRYGRQFDLEGVFAAVIRVDVVGGSSAGGNGVPGRGRNSEGDTAPLDASGKYAVSMSLLVSKRKLLRSICSANDDSRMLDRNNLSRCIGMVCYAHGEDTAAANGLSA